MTMTRNMLAIAPMILAAAVTAATARADSFCYDAGTYDRDGDGYADLRGLDADDPQFLVNGNCPRSAVEKSGDCDDNNAAVHPRRSELGYNNVNDNCRDSVDEPAFYYARDGIMNTASSFRMWVYLNHADILASARAGTLRADITYAKLSNTADETVIAKRVVDSFGDDFAFARIDLNNLSAGTVYHAKVKFFRRNANATYTAVGPATAWYHTMTDSANDKVHKRFQIVLKGLNEADQSAQGKVGYRGTVNVDGTRYGASIGEAWCTEFYVWVTQTWLQNIGGRNDTGDMRDYFRAYDSFYNASEIPDRAAPGDYLYLDTDRDGTVNHSAMFLAYDSTAGKVWTLEGNTANNEVRVNNRTADWNQQTPVFLRLGYIVNAMLL